MAPTWHPLATEDATSSPTTSFIANYFINKLSYDKSICHKGTHAQYSAEIICYNFSKLVKVFIHLLSQGNQNQLESYIKIIYSIPPTIKFTYDQQKKELTYLDITLNKGQRFEKENILDIKTHIKETNKQLYIHANSYNSKATKKQK